MIDHSLRGKLDGHSWTVEFPVYIDCTCLNGRDDEQGVARQRLAVTRHPIFAVSTLLVDTIDVHWERHLPSYLVFDHTAPTAAEFVLDRLTPPDNRYDVGVQQPETGAIVEASIKVDGLDARLTEVPLAPARTS